MRIQLRKIRDETMKKDTKMKIIDRENFFLILTLKLRDRSVEMLIIIFF
jgi:hypothetical protein